MSRKKMHKPTFRCNRLEEARFHTLIMLFLQKQGKKYPKKEKYQ
jgi:hypothetical protein